MRTLTYGLKLPETADPGETWFGALEDNIEQLDAHTHNGTDSPAITGVVAVDLSTQSILAAAWVAEAGSTGLYYQDITLPTVLSVQLQFDEVAMEFRTSAGAVIYPDVVKLSATSYRVKVNDNSLALTAVYFT